MRSIASDISITMKSFGPGMQGITTGFPSLDSCTRGLLTSKVIVVAARSGCGKSSLMLDMALAASREAPVAIFSIEMPFSLVQTRALANITKLNHEALVLDKLLPIEKIEVQNAAKVLEELPIVVDDSACTMFPASWEDWKKVPEDSFNTKLKQQAEAGTKIVFLDYLQLIRMAGKYDRDDLRLHEITWLLHQKAKEYDICIVLLSQLRRFDQDRYKNGSPRPRLDDLFGSSTTENDVDVAVLIHRPSYYEQKVKIDLFENRVEDDVELIIAKSRNGSTGVLNANFLSYCMKFQDVKNDLGF